MQTEPDRLSRSAKWVLLVGLTLVLLAMIAAAAEVAIRFRQTLRYGSADTVEALYTPDSRICLRVPIASLRSGRIQTNSLGFRGPEIVLPKPAGTTRIAFLGASTTWCGEVSGNDQVWPHLVAAQMRRAYPRATIDYVNGGVPGYTVESSIKNLNYRVAQLDPDVIVIYHATNDLSGELHNLAVINGLMPDSEVQARSWLSSHSLLWNLAQKNFSIWLAKKKSEANIGLLEVEPAALGDGFGRELTTLVRAAQQHSKVVALATFATQLRVGQTAEQQLQASSSALYYMPFMTPAGLVKSYRRYNEIITEVAHATGAVLIGGEEDIPGDSLHFADTVHFTDAGSQAMAVRVTKALTLAPEIGTLLSATR